jgi:AraC-like DNA-binding protein
VPTSRREPSSFFSQARKIRRTQIARHWPNEVAMRELQRKIVTKVAPRNTREPSCAHLLERRASLGIGQPLNEIAYACGVRDYIHFARKFRRRFGHVPCAQSGELDRAGDRVVRANTGESAPSAHDVRPPAI